MERSLHTPPVRPYESGPMSHISDLERLYNRATRAISPSPTLAAIDNFPLIRRASQVVHTAPLRNEALRVGWADGLVCAAVPD